MNNLTTIKLNNNLYYNTEELSKIKKDYYSICGNKLRTIVSWKKISEDNYIYAYQKDNNWILSNIKYARSKLLLTKKFCDENIMTYKQKEIKNNVVEKNQDELNFKYEELPTILELNENEKFRDDNNNVLEIEIRGERKYDKIYFKASDIEKEFVIPNLVKHIMSKDTKYEYGIHYKFYCGQPPSSVDKITKHNSLYLTYFGLIRYIFVSKGNKIAEQIQEWALKKLFTHQFGTVEQKKHLAGELLGIPYNDMKRFLNIHINEIPCVYLIGLGCVHNLRDVMNIPEKYIDDSIIHPFL